MGIDLVSFFGCLVRCFGPIRLGSSIIGLCSECFSVCLFAAFDAKEGARPTKIVVANVIVNVLVLLFAFFMLPTNSALEKLEEMNQPTSLFEHLLKKA
ncbi:hypothetical protein ACEV8V_10435 [Vibrio parahaemolyticus]